LDKPNINTINMYRPPLPIGGDADKIALWRTHVDFVFGEYAEHIIQWLAWRVQHPEVKINHGLLLGSLTQGIGKDMMLKPVRRAIGEWNFADVSAVRAFEKAYNENSFLESVICRINEAHDLGDKRFSFYDRTKDWFAEPPEVLMVRDLWIKQHPVLNCT